MAAGTAVSQIEAVPPAVRWIMPGEAVTVQGLTIDCGGFYLGVRLPAHHGTHNDACLIEPQLPAEANPRKRHPAALPHPPRYAAFSSEQRAALLQWLAGQRKDQHVPIEFGWWQLYGYERRLLIDGPDGLVAQAERTRLNDDLVRLRRMFERDPALIAALDQLLTFSWLLLDTTQPFAQLSLIADRRFVLPLQLELALHALRATDVPFALMLRWLRLHPSLALRLPRGERAEQLQQRLHTALQQRFGDAVRLPQHSSRLTLQLLPFNPDLTFDPRRLPTLPDPFNDALLLQELAALIDGRDGAGPTVPPDAATELARFCAAGPVLLPRATVERLAAAEAADDAGTGRQPGFAVVPSTLLHGPEQAAELVVYALHDGAAAPSALLRSHAAVVRLAVAATGVLTAGQLQVLVELLDRRVDLRAAERHSLQMLLRWALSTTDATAAADLATVIARDDLPWAGGLLQALEAAGDPTQPTQLAQARAIIAARRVRGNAQLPPVEPEAGSAAVDDDEAPVLISPAETPHDYDIPTLNVADLPASSGLNLERLQRSLADTARAQALLAAEMAAGEALQAASERTATPLIVEPARLSAPHLALLNRLISREQWTRDEVTALCRDYRVMIDGALEAMNAWGYEQGYDTLIEDDGDLLVDQAAGRELCRGT